MLGAEWAEDEKGGGRGSRDRDRKCCKGRLKVKLELKGQMKWKSSPWGVWHLRRRGDVQVQDCRLLFFGWSVSGAAGRLSSDQGGIVLKTQHHSLVTFLYSQICFKCMYAYQFTFKKQIKWLLAKSQIQTKYDLLADGRSLPHVVLVCVSPSINLLVWGTERL